MKTRYVQGVIDLKVLSPATLTSVSKALATLDQAARAGDIIWENRATPARQRRTDARLPGQRRLEPQESAILACLSDHHEWVSAGEVASKASMLLTSVKIRLSKLWRAGYVERKPKDRLPGERGKQQYLYRQHPAK